MSKAKIDIENRQIIGESGKVYKILPESLSIGRAAEFQIRGVLLGFRTDFESMLIMVDNAVKRLRGGQTFGDISDTIIELERFRKGLVDYQLNTRPALVEFCSLFCIGEGEETGTHSEDVIREKYNDWKTIPEQDFFFLCAHVIPSFRENYLKMLNQEKSDQKG